MCGMKKILIVIVVLFLAVVGLSIYKFSFINSDINIKNEIISDYKNATYSVGGYKVTLKNGVSEQEPIPGSASKIITRYFGNEVRHDLNDDGREDIAFLLTQETGGSGVFFYVVAALNTPDGYIGSEGLLLGDRIAPQTTHMDEGETVRGTNRQNVIVVNYAVRLPGEPFTTRPSLGKSIWIKLDPVTMQFGEVAQNFEGETDL